MLKDRIECFGTCGISHRWSSSRDDCSRSSSSNNSDIEGLLEAVVIVRLFRSAAYIPIKNSHVGRLDVSSHGFVTSGSSSPSVHLSSPPPHTTTCNKQN